jgi:trk system potassium uptake protein TrkH
LVAATAALSNTGPAFTAILGENRGFSEFLPAQQAVLAVAMILGRVETLAVIALFNPDSWSTGSARSKKTGKSGDETTLSGW